MNSRFPTVVLEAGVETRMANHPSFTFDYATPNEIYWRGTDAKIIEVIGTHKDVCTDPVRETVH
ncbi:MAG: hypothetical protein KBD21_03555 [Candidatus Pacebacteria bacterium]|nr:hypothetical protein [Candidatus Paceibacterota bacterium]